MKTKSQLRELQLMKAVKIVVDSQKKKRSKKNHFEILIIKN